MSSALVSLGSNLGDHRAALDAAVEKLRQTPGITQIIVSSYHATVPIGGPAGQEEFLNAAAAMETSLAPRQLLAQLQRVESELGRRRESHWGPRTLDLDLLLLEQEVIDEPGLIVPHRFLPFRRFVLEPAAEVAADMVHPELGWSIGQMLRHVQLAPAVFELRASRQFADEVAAACNLMVSELAQGRETYRLSSTPAHDRPVKARFVVLYDHALAKSNVAIPTLNLSADDLALARREAIAAIQAMQ